MRIKALVKRIFQQMLRDKRTLALLFVAPLLIITLMYFLFNGNSVNPKLGLVNINEQLTKTLQSENIDVKKYDNASKATIIDNKLDGILQVNGGNVKLILENGDPSKGKEIQMKVNQAVAAQLQANLSKVLGNFKTPDISIQYIYGNSNTSFFDVLSPLLVGFFVFFFVFLISGIGLLRERTTGTLERLMSTPIRRYEIITGYLVGYGVFAIIQTLILVLYAIHVLSITLVGSLWNVLLINLLLALVALSLGILLSTFAASEFQMVQFIPLVIIPQVFFAGIFPVDGMASWLRAFGKIMPIYYGADALKGVMYKGWGLNKISGDIFVLLLFSIVFVALNTLALKKYRKL